MGFGQAGDGRRGHVSLGFVIRKNKKMVKYEKIVHHVAQRPVSKDPEILS
jgi:hypothetical protein